MAATLIRLGAKDTAQLIRRILKGAFPSCKFSVTTGRGSGVSSVDVKWTDGPTEGRVNALIGGLEAGSFDGMTDMYVYDRDRVFMYAGTAYEPGCRYIFTRRSISAKLANACIQLVANWWGGIPAEARPVASEARSGGYTLDGASVYQSIRADLTGVHMTWYAQIHKAAEDRSAFVRGEG